MNTLSDFEATIHDGRPAWRHLPSGRVIPRVSGGSDIPPATPPAPAPTPAPPAPTPSGDGEPEKTFTQADLDKHAGRRAAEAKRAAATELAEQLGVSPAEAKKIIEQHQASAEAAKTDVQKAKEAEAAANARADAAEAASAEAKFEGRIKDQLLAAGVLTGLDPAKPEDREAATKRLARARRLLDLAPESTDDEIAAKVTEIQTDVPGLFGALGGTPGAPSGVTPGGPPAGGQKPATGIEAGRQRATTAATSNPPADPLARWAKPA